VGRNTPGKDYYVGTGGDQRRLHITRPQWGLRRRRK
jgi:hypothetical protein